MRTQEQIRNLRRVFLNIFGRYAMFAPDEEIDMMGDRIQEEIDKRNENIKSTWEIKVRLEDKPDQPWSEIESEPKSPYHCLREMKRISKELLKTYSRINAIQITNMETKEEYVFEREENNEIY